MPSAVNTIDPTIASALQASLGVGKGAELNSQAYLKQCSGDLKGVERAYLEVIKAREQGLGTEHLLIAIPHHELGELYMAMAQLDKAEEYFNRALAIRIEKGSPKELAIARDNLGRLFETKDDLQAAVDIRRQGGSDNVACSNYSGVSALPLVVLLSADR